tara:strand:- start:14 stop:400 length:387 start_codon:yes stop_codon:yes gene_type:complete
MINKKLICFRAILLFVLFVVYWAHSLTTNNENLPTLYVLNASVAILVYFFAYVFRNKHREYLAFYFLPGSIIKFSLFFLVILPIFKEDDRFSKDEFFAFFVPYIVTLVIETISLIWLLNKVNNQNIKN